MNSLDIVLKEIRQRKVSAFLVVLAVAVATATVLTVVALNRALSDEVRKLTRDMGTNLLVFPKDSQLDRFFHGAEPPAETLPQPHIEKLLALEPPIARHIVGKLLTSVRIDGHEYVLAGTSREADFAEVADAPKPLWRRRAALAATAEQDTASLSGSQLGMVIASGSVQVGALAAEQLGWTVGEAVLIEDRAFRVEEVLLETGSRDDFTIFAPLGEVQEMLGRPGELTVIEALGCLCAGDYLSIVKERIEEVLPGTRVISLRSIAVTRVRARRSVARFSIVLSLVVVALSALAGAASFLSNVGHRRTEIGILMAMGCRTRRVVWLFLAKAVVCALSAGAVAFLAAAVLVRTLTPVLTSQHSGLPAVYLLWAGAFALALGVLASLPAVWRLCRLDPVDVLRPL
jgi:putative ABC transport system permease protein